MLNLKPSSRKNLASSLALAAAMTSLLAACGMIKNLNEMHDTMSQMAGTTQGMAGTTQGMADTTREMNDKISETNNGIIQTNGNMTNMYGDLRQGDGVSNRAERLKGMERTNSVEAKISEAGKYFMGFEFQLTKANGNDDQEHVDLMKLYAVREFFREMTRYQDGFETDPATDDSDQLNLFAFSVAMHEINPNEQVLINHGELPKVSFMSMIEDTLKKKKQIESGEIQAKEWEHELLSHEEDAVYMLQLRANFLGAMTLDRLTGIGDKRFLGKAKMMFFNYSVDLKRPNGAQIEDCLRWTNESLRVRALLNSLGYSARMNGKLLKIYGNMELQSRSEKAPQKRLNAEQELIKAIDKFRS
jgi:hypothetical protein